jgi:hypothetical protein
MLVSPRDSRCIFITTPVVPALKKLHGIVLYSKVNLIKVRPLGVLYILLCN